MPQIVYIDSRELFHQHFPSLRESARGNSVPDHFLVGFDIEYVEGNPKKVCVIQIGTAEIVLVIHVSQFQLSLPKQLLQLIQSPAWIKVGVGVGLDLHYVATEYKLGHCSGGIDLKNLALVLRIPQLSLVGLYNRFLKPQPPLPEKSKTSVYNWALPSSLPAGKVEYAGKDAYMGYMIFRAMMLPLYNKLPAGTITATPLPSSPSLNLLQDDEPEPVARHELLLDMSPPKKNGVGNVTATDTTTTSMMVVLKPPAPDVNYIGRLNEYAQQHRVPPAKYAFATTFTGEHSCACAFGSHTTQSIARNKKQAKQQATALMFEKVTSAVPNQPGAVQRLDAHAKRNGMLAPLYSVASAKGPYGQVQVVCGFDRRHVFGYGMTEELSKEAAAKEMVSLLVLEGK